MSPWAPVAVIGVVAAGGLAAWHFFFRDGEGGDQDLPPGPMPGPIPQPDDDQTPSPKPPPSVPTCSRTGTQVDVDRFGSPVEVAAFLVALGYPVSPSLVTTADKSEIKRFQRRARQLALPGLKGASDKWIDGLMGPCTLVALGAAVDLSEDGQWDIAKARSA